MDWNGAALTPLAGGYSGETFVAAGSPDYVVRIYARNPDRAPIDAALIRLVRGLLPVPEVVEIRQATAENPAVLVTERLRGVALDRVLEERRDVVDWGELGHQLGRALAILAGIPVLRPGMFTGPDLRADPSTYPGDLDEWARLHRETSRMATWSTGDWEGLLGLVAAAEETLHSDGTWPERTVLVHSDFNPKNLLVDPDTWQLTGVVDWEFAYAGSNYTDYGNLTRFERHPDFLQAVEETFLHFGAGSPEDPFRRGRALDLWALIELAGRPATNAVTEIATTLLLAQVRRGDVTAWPWDEPRKAASGR